MTTYAKLEVNSDGEILQSSYVVPGDGVLPIAQASSSDLTSLKTYSQSFFPATATVALDGEEAAMRITGILFPTHLKGRAYLKLLGPIIAVAVTVYGVLGLLFTQNSLDQVTLTVVALFVIGVALLLVIVPSWMWFKWLYYQGAPTYRVQRKVQQNYPNISVYHDKKTFLLDTAP